VVVLRMMQILHQKELNPLGLVWPSPKLPFRVHYIVHSRRSSYLALDQICLTKSRSRKIPNIVIFGLLLQPLVQSWEHGWLLWTMTLCNLELVQISADGQFDIKLNMFIIHINAKNNTRICIEDFLTLYIPLYNFHHN
jgi:hypothetical protein